MSPGEVAAIMFGTFGVLIVLRIPVSFALGLACVPVFFFDDRLTPVMLINEMWKSYNAFILLAVPFFLLAANLMNAAGITERLVNLAKALVGHLPGGLAHVNVLVSITVTSDSSGKVIVSVLFSSVHHSHSKNSLPRKLGAWECSFAQT